MKKNILSILLALTILFIYRGSAYATSEGFTVSPAIEELRLTPGQEATYDLVITNNADTPLGIHSAVTTFQTPDEGAKDTLTPSPLISWTEVTPEDTIIESHEEKTLTVTISPPVTLKKGGYYAAIFLTPFISRQQDKNAPIVLTQVGTLLLAQYGDIDYTNLTEKVQLQNVGFEKLFFEKPPFSLSFAVSNQYFTHLTAKPFVTLTPLFGKPQHFVLSEKHILPGKSKLWEESLHPSSFSLFYTGELAVSVGAGNYVSQPIFVVEIPGLHDILLAVILLFLGLVATYHKRARKAFFILLSGSTQ